MNHGPPNAKSHLENLNVNSLLGTAGHHLGLGTANFITTIDLRAGASPVVNA